MKCRAKMTDGSPVTFEWISIGNAFVEYAGGHCSVIDMIGEGFFVRSIKRDGSSDPRILAREALERSGVDTATVEYWAPETRRTAGDHEFRYLGTWEPLFPPIPQHPVLREEPATPMPNSITYVSDFEDPTETDTYEQKLAKAVKWADGQMAVRGFLRQRGAWALHILAHLGEARLTLGSTPTGKPPEWLGGGVTLPMIDSGMEEMRDCDLEYGRKEVLAAKSRHTLARVWRAMEKARTR